MASTDDVQVFNARIDDWLKSVKIDHNKAVQALALRLFENVVRRTPVGDPTYWKRPAPVGYVGGFARNNWFVTIGDKSIASPSRKAGVSDAQVMAEIFLKVKGGKFGDVFWMQNSVDYILPLEHGTASPRQAPNGMVAVTMAEMRQFFAQYSRERRT